MDYKNGTALVTGASGKGIGWETALALREAGFRVWATARKDEDMARLRAEGFDSVRLDLAYDASMIAAVETVGTLDLLVNNAGMALMGPTEELDPAALRAQFETNVFGPVRLAGLVLPGMRAAGKGRIVNVSSLYGEVTMPLGGAYNASKFALEAFSDVLRMEVRPFGIQVVIVQPSAVRTAFQDIADASLKTPSGSPYSDMAARVAEMMKGSYTEKSGAILPAEVAKAIVRAATDPRPRIRYRVGRPSRLLGTLRPFVPDRVWDALMAKSIA